MSTHRAPGRRSEDGAGAGIGPKESRAFNDPIQSFAPQAIDFEDEDIFPHSVPGAVSSL